VAVNRHGDVSSITLDKGLERSLPCREGCAFLFRNVRRLPEFDIGRQRQRTVVPVTFRSHDGCWTEAPSKVFESSNITSEAANGAE
jgi:hypothetical protein